MFIGTHASVPVLLASLADMGSLVKTRRLLFEKKHLAAIALAGVLPDLLSPHISLQARLTSFSHTIWFLLVLFPALIIVSKFLFGRRYLLMGVSLWLASTIHLFLDLSAGGINPTYPLGQRIGFYLVHYRNWVVLDLVSVALTLAVVISLRHFAKASSRPVAAALEREPDPLGPGVTAERLDLNQSNRES